MTFPDDKFHNKNNMHLLPFSNPRYSESINLHVEDSKDRSILREGLKQFRLYTFRFNGISNV